MKGVIPLFRHSGTEVPFISGRCGPRPTTPSVSVGHGMHGIPRMSGARPDPSALALVAAQVCPGARKKQGITTSPRRFGALRWPKKVCLLANVHVELRRAMATSAPLMAQIALFCTSPADL